MKRFVAAIAGLLLVFLFVTGASGFECHISPDAGLASTPKLVSVKTWREGTNLEQRGTNETRYLVTGHHFAVLMEIPILTTIRVFSGEYQLEKTKSASKPYYQEDYYSAPTAEKPGVYYVEISLPSNGPTEYDFQIRDYGSNSRATGTQAVSDPLNLKVTTNPSWTDVPPAPESSTLFLTLTRNAADWTNYIYSTDHRTPLSVSNPALSGRTAKITSVVVSAVGGQGAQIYHEGVGALVSGQGGSLPQFKNMPVQGYWSATWYGTEPWAPPTIGLTIKWTTD